MMNVLPQSSTICLIVAIIILLLQATSSVSSQEAPVVSDQQTSRSPSGIQVNSARAPFPTPKTSQRFNQEQNFYLESATVFTLINSLSFPRGSFSRNQRMTATFDLSASADFLAEFSDLDNISKVLKYKEERRRVIKTPMSNETTNSSSAPEDNSTTPEDSNITTTMMNSTNSSSTTTTGIPTTTTTTTTDIPQDQNQNQTKYKTTTTSLDFHVTWVLHLVNRETFVEYIVSHRDEVDLSVIQDSFQTVTGETILSLENDADSSDGRDPIDWRKIIPESEYNNMTNQEVEQLPQVFPAVFPPTRYRTFCTNVPALRSFVVGTLPGDLERYYRKKEKQRRNSGTPKDDNSPNSSGNESDNGTSTTTIVTSEPTSNDTSSNQTTTMVNDNTTATNITATTPTETIVTSTTTPSPTPTPNEPPPTSLRRTISFDVNSVRGDEFALILSKCVWSTTVSDSYNKIATRIKTVKKVVESPVGGNTTVQIPIDTRTKLKYFDDLSKYVFKSQAISAAAAVDISYSVSLPAGSNIGRTSLSVAQTLEGLFAMELVGGIVYMILGIAAVMWLYLRNEVLTANELERQRNLKRRSSAGGVLCNKGLVLCPSSAASASRNPKNSHKKKNKQDDELVASNTIDLQRMQKLRKPPPFVFLAVYTLIGRGAFAVVTIVAAQLHYGGHRIDAVEVLSQALQGIAAMCDVFAVLWLCTGFSVTRRTITKIESQLCFIIMLAYFIFGVFSSVCATAQAPNDLVDSLIETPTAFGINCDTVFTGQSVTRIISSLIAVGILMYQEKVMLADLTNSKSRSGYNNTNNLLGRNKNSSSDDTNSSDERENDEEKSLIAGNENDQKHEKGKKETVVTLLPLCTVDMWLRLRDFKIPFLFVGLLPIITAVSESVYTALGSELWLTFLNKVFTLFLELMVLYYFYDVAEHRR